MKTFTVADIEAMPGGIVFTRPTKKFRVTIFKKCGREILHEETVRAENMAGARKPYLDRGIAAHRVYVLEI